MCNICHQSVHLHVEIFGLHKCGYPAGADEHLILVLCSQLFRSDVSLGGKQGYGTRLSETFIYSKIWIVNCNYHQVQNPYFLIKIKLIISSFPD